MNLSEPFIRRPVMTVLLTVASILFGVLAYKAMPVNDLPAVDYPVIQVQCAYPGASPETMANNVATPLERQFMQIPGLEVVTSATAGRETVQLHAAVCAVDKSLDAAATDTQTAITQATGELPTDLPSPPTLSKTNPNDQPIQYIAALQQFRHGGAAVRPTPTRRRGSASASCRGVSRVLVYGSQSAVRIKADPSALAARGLDDGRSGEGRFRTAPAIRAPASWTGTIARFLLQPQGQLDNAGGSTTTSSSATTPSLQFIVKRCRHGGGWAEGRARPT